MDIHTTNTRKWLNQRFNNIDPSGIYLSHQPIYGFRGGHCSANIMSNYAVTNQILIALSRLKFNSMIDIGGAEGYKAALIRDIFDATVRSCDLADQACIRAAQIYGIPGESVDIHHLPYIDNSFDIVVSSETIEHVTDYKRAVRELYRICRGAVIITIPIESIARVSQFRSGKKPHAHLHSFNEQSFNFISPPAKLVLSRRILSSWTRFPFILAEAMPRYEFETIPAIIGRLYNLLTPILRVIFTTRSAKFLINIDDFIANYCGRYSGLLVTIIKDPDFIEESNPRKSFIQRIIEFQVPYHYPMDDFG